MIRTLCILLCIITLGSCSNIRIPVRSDIQPLSETSLSTLNGSYPNTPDSSTHNMPYTLWRQLKLRNHRGPYKTTLTVQLQATGPRTLQARLMDGAEQVDRKKLQGRYRKGYFYLRPKSAFYGMVLIYWVSLGLDTRLGTNGQGQLFADTEYSHGGGFFLFSAGSTDKWSAVYNKR